jgi:histone deacetylase 1/2
MSPPPASRSLRAGRVLWHPDRLNLSAVVTSVPAVPTTFRQAMQDPLWRAAMMDEYQALIDNNTWSLVPCPPRANVITGKWICRHKFNSDGTLACRKAHWVVRGYSQCPGIDYDETFSPVAKPETIRLILSIVVSSDWPIRQLDVKNAFLNGNLDEVVHYQQPPGFVDPAHPNHVCRLHKSLYGLKQAPRAWYQRFASYLSTLGFAASVTDTSLIVLRSSSDTVYLLIYVDDIIVTASSSGFL